MKGHNQELDTRSVPRKAKAPSLVSTNVVGAGEKLQTTQRETLGQQALGQSHHLPWILRGFWPLTQTTSWFQTWARLLLQEESGVSGLTCADRPCAGLCPYHLPVSVEWGGSSSSGEALALKSLPIWHGEICSMPLIPLSNFSLLKKEACKQAVSLDGHLFCGNKSCDFTFHFGAPPHVLCAVLCKDPD